MLRRVFIIAGSDPSGGAGLQADVKTATALGAYAAAAVTALTVQNTTGVFAVEGVAPDFIVAQIDAVLSDIGADAIKIGMIAEPAAVRAIAGALKARARDIPIVLDPVLAATSGDALAGDGVAGVLLAELAPLARLVTPNTDELAALSFMEVRTEAAARRAAEALRDRIGGTAVLAKGGHIPGKDVVDFLATEGGVREFRHPRLEVSATHGSGCTLSTAIAAGLAAGAPLDAAVERAIDYVHEAIRTAPALGAGARPLDHLHPIRRI